MVCLHLAQHSDDQTVATFQLEMQLAQQQLAGWKLQNGDKKSLAVPSKPAGVEVALGKILEVKLPLKLLGALEGQTFDLRFGFFRDRVPVDALPQEGSLEIQIAPEDLLTERAYMSR
jgi:hypothetical protein